MATQKPFLQIELPQQKILDENVVFPLVLSPNTNTNSNAIQISSFEATIKAHKPWLVSLLVKHGAILFRGFPVTSPSDFNKVVEAFDYLEFPYVGGVAPRIHVTGRVYTANESPLDMKIPFHHEMAYIPDPPTKIFFFCEEEPKKGGETPITLSHMVYEKMKESHPDFVTEIEEHGLRYVQILGESEDDSSSYTHGNWKMLFKTDDKNIAEQRAAKLGARLEWSKKTVKVITNPLQAIRFDEESCRKTWFNSLEASANDNTLAEVGNGNAIQDDIMDKLSKTSEEESVAIPWKKGDVMLVNNLTVLHGRRPLITPPRLILASLCK